MILSTSASGTPSMNGSEMDSLACASVLKANSVDLSVRTGIDIHT